MQNPGRLSLIRLFLNFQSLEVIRRPSSHLASSPPCLVATLSTAHTSPLASPPSPVTYTSDQAGYPPEWSFQNLPATNPYNPLQSLSRPFCRPQSSPASQSLHSPVILQTRRLRVVAKQWETKAVHTACWMDIPLATSTPSQTCIPPGAHNAAQPDSFCALQLTMSLDPGGSDLWYQMSINRPNF